MSRKKKKKKKTVLAAFYRSPEMLGVSTSDNFEVANKVTNCSFVE
jgi:hypothetical protein